jgi:hypothetical protein
MPNSRSMWFMIVLAAIFMAAAFVTLRAAEKVPTHPPPSAPEETATIVDDPTTAPDAGQSADNNVSFPADI